MGIHQAFNARVQPIDIASDVLVDAFVRLDGPGATRLTAGRFKSPFSERRLDSIWSLPVVDRGLVDHYLVKSNGLGGRRVGLAGTWRPWDGALDATTGVFLGDRNALEAGSDTGEDWAGRVAVHAVVVELPLPARGDEPGLREDLQVMRDGGLGEPEDPGQLLAADLVPLRDRAEQAEAGRVAERLRDADGGGLSGVHRHIDVRRCNGGRGPRWVPEGSGPLPAALRGDAQGASGI